MREYFINCVTLIYDNLGKAWHTPLFIGSIGEGESRFDQNFIQWNCVPLGITIQSWILAINVTGGNI
jgi:hypothetical protein